MEPPLSTIDRYMRKTLLILLTVGLLAVPAMAQEARNHAPFPSADPVLMQDRVDDPSNDGYELSAASPNPFDYRTSFTIEVDELQEIHVEVYNILGQRVRSLYQGLLEPDFPMRLFFDADNLPNGIYVYRVRGETFEASRKVTLLR